MTSDPIPSDEERFIPLADFEHMKEQFFEERERKLRALDERDQLRDALAQVNAGITKASETLNEGIARLRDKQKITDLVFELLKHHPECITVKYRGEEIAQIFGEK